MMATSTSRISDSTREACSISTAEGRPCARVLGVLVDAVNMRQALERIAHHLDSGAKGYVCAVGVHGVLEALRNVEVARTFEAAALVVPDGTPIVWVGRAQGFGQMDAVPGPELMMAMVEDQRFRDRSHFFYGGKPGVAGQLVESLRAKFPWIHVAGTYTPPFRDLTVTEEAEVVRQINGCRPDVVWMGISTPRQDLWMRRMISRLDTRMMFGVGAAFDFNSGQVRNCPRWVKRAGLHWLHRLMQDPKRLWRRNVSNLAFLWHIALQLGGVRDYGGEDREFSKASE